MLPWCGETDRPWCPAGRTILPGQAGAPTRRMTPELGDFIREFGAPLLAAIVLFVVYYRLQQDVNKDLRAQRDAAIASREKADARTDVALEGLRAQTTATVELTAVVRQVLEPRRATR